MTVGAWVFFWVLAICLVLTGAFFGFTLGDDNWGTAAFGLVLGLGLSIGLFFGMRWYYSSTAAGSRALKTQESNFNNGVKRRVEVYDATGNLIKEYTGTFDIEYDDDRILFDDEHGLRHIIYYPTGTVIVDELD